MVNAPYPLDHLTITPLSIPEIALRPDIRTIHVQKVIFGAASLECLVELSTGEILIFGVGNAARTEDDLGDDIIDIRDLRNAEKGGFTSRFMIKAQKSRLAAISLSDIGEIFLYIILESFTTKIKYLRISRIGV